MHDASIYESFSLNYNEEISLYLHFYFSSNRNAQIVQLKKHTKHLIHLTLRLHRFSELNFDLALPNMPNAIKYTLYSLDN